MTTPQSAGKEERNSWNVVSNFDVGEYKCNAIAGMILRQKKTLVREDHTGKPTGEVFPADSEWLVLNGSSQDPGVVFLRDPSGKTHTWDDDASFWDMFESAS